MSVPEYVYELRRFEAAFRDYREEAQSALTRYQGTIRSKESRIDDLKHKNRELRDLLNSYSEVLSIFGHSDISLVVKANNLVKEKGGLQALDHALKECFNCNDQDEPGADVRLGSVHLVDWDCGAKPPKYGSSFVKVTAVDSATKEVALELAVSTTTSSVTSLVFEKMPMSQNIKDGYEAEEHCHLVFSETNVKCLYEQSPFHSTESLDSYNKRVIVQTIAFLSRELPDAYEKLCVFSTRKKRNVDVANKYGDTQRRKVI